MKSCPTSNMNKSQLWGFEVGHIVAGFGILATTNVFLNILGGPLIFSWVAELAHILLFIAGATDNGAVLARHIVVNRSSALP